MGTALHFAKHDIQHGQKKSHISWCILNTDDYSISNRVEYDPQVIFPETYIDDDTGYM